MENKLNKLLVRQIRKHFGGVDNLPEELKWFIQDIDRSYKNFDDDYCLLQNSIEISSQELRDAFQKHKDDAATQKETLKKINEAIFALNPSMDTGHTDIDPAMLNSKYLFDSLIKLIEERKQAEEALLNERSLFRTIIDLLPDAVYVKDIEGRKIIANPKEVQFAGKNTESEIIGQTDFNLYPDKEAKRAFAEDECVLRFGESILNTDGTLIDKTGKLYRLLVSKVPLRDIHGNINGLVGVSHDITETKKLEEEIKLQNDFYNILSTVSGRLIQADSEKLEVEINLSLALLGQFNKVDRVLIFELDPAKDEINNTFQWVANGVVSKKENLKGILFSSIPLWLDTFLKNEHVFIESINDLPEERKVEREILQSQGVQSLLTVPMFYGSSFIGFIGFDSIVEKKQWNEQVIILLKIYASILAGVIYKKKTEAMLVKAKQEAEAANKSKSLFLANMSHEIRTPLNAIIGFSQLMSRDKLLSDLQMEYNTSIILAAEHLLSLINDILELSKVEAGRVVLNPTNVDLHTLIEDIEIYFKDRAHAKHLQFIFTSTPEMPMYAIVDESKLRQIFINIIGNAIKFTDKGIVSVRVKVDRLNKDSDYLIVDVEDTGPGIPESEQNNLFKHFVQTSTGIKKGSGTGLGLVLSRELALLMGGDITVSSEVGKGSIFTFMVELKKGEFETIERRSAKRIICIDKAEKAYRILVVDDKAENLQIATNLLRVVGFDLNEAVNGADAIVKFEEWNPDLILMDMRMPVMNGYEATRLIRLKERGKNLPVIALTASTFEEDKELMKSLNMQGIIRKPFRENELFYTIGNVLGVKYICEEEKSILSEGKYVEDVDAMMMDIVHLPKKLIDQMREAVSVADIDLLIELINSIDTQYAELSRHLLSHATNYDYEYLLQILNQQEIK